MFRESLVDSALNRLSFHFGPRLLVHPPATADILAELEHIVGQVPREFVIFLSTCNGLRLHADGPDPELHLWGSPQIVASVLCGNSGVVPEALLPVRGDPTGERDWLVCGHGPTRGSVIRWDPWIPGAVWIASSFGVYLSAWTDYVLARYNGNGAKTPEERRLKFDRPFVHPRDTRGSSPADEQIMVEWLHHLDHAVACGDDFE